MNRSLHAEDPEAYRLPETREALAQLLLLYTMGLPQGMDINDQVSVKNDAIRMTVMWTERESTRALQAFSEIEAQGKRLGLDVQVTGKFPLMSAMQPYTVNSLVVSVATALLAVSLILVLALRSLVLGLLALLANLLPLIVGGAALQILGYPLDVGTAMTASVALGICVDDTIHFLANYEAYRREGASPQTAVARVFSGTGRALVVTTVILGGAFATFGLGSFLPNVHFGVIVALMLAVALVGDLVLLPALLLLRRQPGVSHVSHPLPAAVDASAESR